MILSSKWHSLGRIRILNGDGTIVAESKFGFLRRVLVSHIVVTFVQMVDRLQRITKPLRHDSFLHFCGCLSVIFKSG